MTAMRTAQQIAAGQLISAIQKEWIAEMGEPAAAYSEEAMDRAHEMLQAAAQNRLPELLHDRSIAEFLGCDWVATHTQVIPTIQALNQHIQDQHPCAKPGEAG